MEIAKSHRYLLSKSGVACLSTLSKDLSIQSSLVWYDFADGLIRINTLLDFSLMPTGPDGRMSGLARKDRPKSVPRATAHRPRVPETDRWPWPSDDNLLIGLT